MFPGTHVPEGWGLTPNAAIFGELPRPWNVRPRFPAANKADCPVRNAKRGRDLFVIFSRGHHGDGFLRGFFRHFRPRVVLASNIRASLAALVPHIVHIVLMSSQEQVPRVYA